MANNINIIIGAIMRKIKLSKYDKYKELRKKIKTLKRREAIEDFKDVNKCIEEILQNKSRKDATEEIKSLICQFEGNLNQANHYSVMAVAYAVLISGFSILSDMISSFIDPNDLVFAKINLSMFIPLYRFIAIVGLIIICIALKTYVRDYKNTFILRALNFKLDELNEKSESSQEICIISEANKTNEANIVNDPDEEKNKKYTPYNFDEEIEYKIYSNIRERYNRKFLGKKTKVHKEYPDFDKYTEWETYFKNKFLTEISDECEFKYYLNDRLRVYQGLVDIGKSVVTPILIALITIVLTIYSTIGLSFIALICSLLVGMILIMISLMCIIWEHGRKVNFFEDCINIIDSDESSHQ